MRIFPEMRILSKMRTNDHQEVIHMLLPEEQRIIKCLSQYSALTKTQVIRLLHDKPQVVAEKIISNLVRHGHIASISDGYSNLTIH